MKQKVQQSSSLLEKFFSPIMVKAYESKGDKSIVFGCKLDRQKLIVAITDSDRMVEEYVIILKYIVDLTEINYFEEEKECELVYHKPDGEEKKLVINITADFLSFLKEI